MNRQLTALLNNQEKLQPLLRHMPAAVSLVLVIACAHILSQITWMLLAEPESAPSIKAQPRLTRPVHNGADQQAFRRLTNAHLFGRMDQIEATQTATAAPDTRLNLVLRGVLAADPMKTASAIIASGKNGKEEIYGLGETVPGGVTLREVHPEYVILERQGRLETLRLLRDSADVQIETDTESQSAYPATPAEALTSIRKEIMKNPTSFGDYALPVVVKENGKQVGYRLQPQKKGEMLVELGLEPNDVITEINGVKLDQPQNGMSALRALSTANEISLMVKRNGTEVPLNIQLQ